MHITQMGPLTEVLARLSGNVYRLIVCHSHLMPSDSIDSRQFTSESEMRETLSKLDGARTVAWQLQPSDFKAGLIIDRDILICSGWSVYFLIVTKSLACGGWFNVFEPLVFLLLWCSHECKRISIIQQSWVYKQWTQRMYGILATLSKIKVMVSRVATHRVVWCTPSKIQWE